jgi:serine/threonine-protein kinase
MPLAERSLRQLLTDGGGRIDVETTIAVLRDVATALDDLGGRVVHRDVKPENILLLDGHWCLADFGISRYAEATTSPDTQKFALSVQYAAPERWRFERATNATDVYSLGIIGFEMLAGSLPFDGPTTEEFREQHLHGQPPQLEGAPAALASLLDECLFKSPEARPTPAKLLARLQGALTAPRLAGLAALQQVDQTVVAGRREASREASFQASAAERRKQLVDAAGHGLQRITSDLLTAVEDAAPSVTRERKGASLEALHLGEAILSVSQARPCSSTNWGNWEAPAFDVVAVATISVHRRADRSGYQGRSHSLWYCDAQVAGEFAWFETAFMWSPFLARSGREDPFALDPGEDAAKALWAGMAEVQMAWPFLRIETGQLVEFIDRWASWFAAAAAGSLGHPSQMPERNPSGSWRRT